MVLSDIDIRNHVASGEITITPFDETKMKPGSYTFTLGEVILIPTTQGIIDAEKTIVSYEEVHITKDGYVMQPGDFILGQTREQLSISRNLCCILDARTTLVRIGLCPLQGSTLIEPGQQESHETLEFSNNSRNPIRIHVGMNVVKGIFIKLSQPSEQIYAEIGTYAKQSRPERIL